MVATCRISQGGNPGAEVRQSPQSRSSKELRLIHRIVEAGKEETFNLIVGTSMAGVGTVATMSWDKPDLVSMMFCGSWLMSYLVNI